MDFIIKMFYNNKIVPLRLKEVTHVRVTGRMVRGTGINPVPHIELQKARPRILRPRSKREGSLPKQARCRQGRQTQRAQASPGQTAIVPLQVMQRMAPYLEYGTRQAKAIQEVAKGRPADAAVARAPWIFRPGRAPLPPFCFDIHFRLAYILSLCLHKNTAI